MIRFKSICIIMTASAFGAPLAAPSRSGAAALPIVTANTSFALDLYQRERSTPGNLFYSPYSVSTALAMTYSGARGQTAAEMARVLHFNLPQPDVARAFASLAQQLDAVAANKAVKLDVANSVWCQKDFPFNDSFLTLARAGYHAEARLVDFVQNPESTRQAINAWISEKTQGKIPDLIQPGQLSAATRLALCNAIYFKGQWADRFDPKATQPAPFFTRPGHQVPTSLMTHQVKLRTRAFEDFAAASLPYISNELSMVILLPRNVDGLAGLEQRLSAANLTEWLTALDAAPELNTDLFLPKFKLNSRLLLAGTLSALGMPTAFSARADFSGLSARPALQISDVVHQAYVEVNEEGTEAAAATGVIMRMLAVQQRIPVFRVDHPFLFLIRDNPTGTLLFVGRVVDPSG